MDLGRIAKLRLRGGLETGPDGAECARLSIQKRDLLDAPSYEALKARLGDWAVSLDKTLNPHGGAVMPETLSGAGQTVEALIPVDALRRVSEQLEREGLRLDFVESRKIV